MRQRVLPTFAVIIGGGGTPMHKVGSFNAALMVHGEQGIELFDEIPPGRRDRKQRQDRWHLGQRRRGIVLESESESFDKASGKRLLKTRSMLFCRGEGGWGGERGPSAKVRYPDAEPTHQVTYATRQDQALTYRLSGDRNPLHSDPSFASSRRLRQTDPAWAVYLRLHRAGAPAFALRWRTVRGFRSMNARFSKPRDSQATRLTVSIWADNGKALFRTTNDDGDVVIDQGVCTYA